MLNGSIKIAKSSAKQRIYGEDKSNEASFLP
jgi:hypothetical protein